MNIRCPDEVKELINRRRRQMMVHSHIYYRLNDNIIDDHIFDQWAKELVKLQNDHRDIAKGCVFADEFIDFDGTTGYHLNTFLVHEKAGYILRVHRSLTVVQSKDEHGFSEEDWDFE